MLILRHCSFRWIRRIHYLIPNPETKLVKISEEDLIKWTALDPFTRLTEPTIKEPIGLMVLNEKDLKEFIAKGWGHGGQKVNKSRNCVTLHHIPSGIIIKCHEHRSLLANQKAARTILKAKLNALYIKEMSDLQNDKRQRDRTRDNGD